MASDAVRRMVVRMPNWLGDAVMALPALAALRTAYPDAFIAAAAAASVAPIFEERTAFAPQQIAVVDRSSEPTVLRSGGFDVDLLLTNSFRTAWAARRAAMDSPPTTPPPRAPARRC